MITDRSPNRGQTSRPTSSVRPVDVMHSLLSNLVRQHGRTPRVLELGTAGSEPLTATLARETQHRMCHPAASWPSKPDDLTFILFRPGRRTDRRAS